MCLPLHQYQRSIRAPLTCVRLFPLRTGNRNARTFCPRHAFSVSLCERFPRTHHGGSRRIRAVTSAPLAFSRICRVSRSSISRLIAVDKKMEKIDILPEFFECSLDGFFLSFFRLCFVKIFQCSGRISRASDEIRDQLIVVESRKFRLIFP